MVGKFVLFSSMLLRHSSLSKACCTSRIAALISGPPGSCLLGPQLFSPGPNLFHSEACQPLAARNSSSCRENQRNTPRVHVDRSAVHLSCCPPDQAVNLSALSSYPTASEGMKTRLKVSVMQACVPCHVSTSRTHTHTHTHTHAERMHARTHTHTLTRAHAYEYIHTHIYTRNTRTPIHAYARTHSHIHKTLSHIRTYTHAHSHTQYHTQTHGHSQRTYKHNMHSHAHKHSSHVHMRAFRPKFGPPLTMPTSTLPCC